MKEARVLGRNVQYLAEKKGLSVFELSQILECSEHQVCRLLKGRAYASFRQIKKLSEVLDTTIEDLLKDNLFENSEKEENAEIILDIIDGFIDIVDSLN